MAYYDVAIHIYQAPAAESDVHLVSIAVAPRRQLVPVHQYDRLPSYYVFAGLVFSPLTQVSLTSVA